jgi:hypothetical protein
MNLGKEKEKIMILWKQCVSSNVIESICSLFFLPFAKYRMVASKWYLIVFITLYTLLAYIYAKFATVDRQDRYTFLFMFVKIRRFRDNIKVSDNFKSNLKLFLYQSSVKRLSESSVINERKTFRIFLSELCQKRLFLYKIR